MHLRPHKISYGGVQSIDGFLPSVAREQDRMTEPIHHGVLPCVYTHGITASPCVELTIGSKNLYFTTGVHTPSVSQRFICRNI